MTTPELVILDVGHGNAAVYLDEGSTVVVDGGPGYTLSRFFAEVAITSIEVIFVSHADEDHLRGILLVLESFPDITPGAIYVNPAQQRQTTLWRSFSLELERLERQGTKIITALTRSSPGNVSVGHGIFEVLSPPPAKVLVENRDNRWSAALRLVVDDRGVALLCGDLDNVALTELLADGATMTSDILVFPHHGGRPGSANQMQFASQLAQAAQPKVVLFSIGRGRFDNPLPAILAGVRTIRDVHVACTQLSRRCSERVYPDRPLPPHSSGGGIGSCCAGTVRYRIDDPVLTAFDSHRKFVDILETGNESPQCRA